MSNLKNKTINILKAEEIKALKFSNDGNKNSLNDGAGLRIVVKQDNTKIWKFIYTFQGIRKDTSFGTFPKVSLAGARIKAKEFRELIENNIDPLENKKEQKQLQKETKKQKQHQINIIIDRYFEVTQHNKGLAESTVIKTKERLKNHFYLHLKEKEKTIIHNISFDDIVKALQILEKDSKLETLSRIKRVIVNVFKFAYTENIIKETEIFGKLELKTFKVQKDIRENPALTSKEDIKKLYNSILVYECHDNAVAESFFHTLKTELIHHEIYHTKEQAKRSIFEYIEVFYNRERSHSANNNLSPVEFEEKQKLLQKEIAA